MYVLTLKDKEEGAFAATTLDGGKALQMFVDKDDAIRYAGLLEADDHPELVVKEVDAESVIKTCEMMGYKYCIVDPNEFVVPINLKKKHDYI